MAAEVNITIEPGTTLVVNGKDCDHKVTDLVRVVFWSLPNGTTGWIVTDLSEDDGPQLVNEW